MNPGLDIFKRAQRYAEGVNNVGLAPGKAPWDYFNPFGGTTKGGSNTGIPTQKGVGTLVGTASNFILPGSGFITGPIARWITSMVQHGLSRNQATKVAQGYVQGGGQSGDDSSAQTTDTTAPASTDTGSTPSAGIGIDPYGNPADPGEFWSNDFGRWGEGDQYGTTPGNYNPPGPGGGIGTRGVWGGQTTIPIQSDPNFVPSLGWAMPAASGGAAYGGNTMAKIAMHGNFRDIATPEQWSYMQNYLGGGGGGGGSGAGVGGAGRPMRQSQQMGDSDIGLRIYKRQQKLQGGTEAVPSELPSPPEEELTMKRNSMSNLRPAMLTKALGQELGSLNKEDVAKMVVAGLLTHGEGGELAPKGEAQPILTRANRNGSTIRASFDATGPAPDPKMLEKQFGDAGHDVSVTKFGTDLISATKGEHNYRIDVWEPWGKDSYRLSSDAAAKAMEGMFGADAPYKGKTQFEQAVPLSERYGSAHEYGTKKLTDVQLREQESSGGLQMGTNDVNPGLKLFHGKQKRKKK